MAADRSCAVMIFSVSDGTTPRDEARSWRRRQEPTFGNYETQDIRQADARLCTQDPRCGVEADEAIETTHLDDCARSVEAGVAIGPAQPYWQFVGYAWLANKRRQFVAKSRTRDSLWPPCHSAL